MRTSVLINVVFYTLTVLVDIAGSVRLQKRHLPHRSSASNSTSILEVEQRWIDLEERCNHTCKVRIQEEALAEANDIRFRLELKKASVIAGLEGHVDYNNHIPRFSRVKNPEAYLSNPAGYLQRNGIVLPSDQMHRQRRCLGAHVAKRSGQGRCHKVNTSKKKAQARAEGNNTVNEPKLAVFILGPSAVGKSSAVALLLKSGVLGAGFPAVTWDGGTWRDVSHVWKTWAQKKDGTRFKNFYDFMFKGKGQTGSPKVEIKKIQTHIFEEWLNKWNEAHKMPRTIVVPDTAVGCMSTRSSASCPILKKIALLRKFKYDVKFLTVHAGPKSIMESGFRRSVHEGKVYSPCSYGLAASAVFALHKSRRFDKKQDWLFMENTFSSDPDVVPDFFAWKDTPSKKEAGYKTRVKRDVCKWAKACPEGCRAACGLALGFCL